MTKEEAKTKICPVMSNKFVINCIAGECMMWKWTDSKKVYKGQKLVEDKKYNEYKIEDVYETVYTKGCCAYKI